MRGSFASLFLGMATTVMLGPPATFSIPHHHQHAFPNRRQAEHAATLQDHQIITPIRVDGDGNFLSHHLDSEHDPQVDHTRLRRAAPVSTDSDEVHYLLTLEGEAHQVTVRPNRRFLAPHAVVERRRGDTGPSSFPPSGIAAPKADLGYASSFLKVIGREPSCHYHGVVRNHTESSVAFSACGGLTGYVRTNNAEFLIEPVRDHARDAHEPHPHLVYRRSALPSYARADDAHSSCATQESYEHALRERDEWEASQEKKGKRRRRKRKRRSVSVERNVEVTVVADKKMVNYYSNEDITTYILTVMNMVSNVYRDASIGNAVNIYVVRIMLLEDPQYEEELDISHNADNTLRSFCQWQQMINPSDEKNPYHHDVAVLITRYNICSRMTDRCSTLGVAEIAGMCQPLRSCNVNEDTGLQIAYTIAHELGHNFGMNHDGPQNGCESLYGVSQHVMSPHLTSDPLPVTWSNCSRKEITHFLDRDWGACLEDEPPSVEYNFPELPPGAMYDANHQCRLSFGAGATHCEGIEGIERVCQTLWCQVDNRCITRMEPAAEGTQCGKHKWCAMGRCVTMGERPAAIHGEWGSWSSWSQCTRTCGAGTQAAERHCNKPAPANGGRYCTGDRKRYRMCNTEECPENGVSFRGQQCSKFDSVPYKGENFTWQPVMYQHTPCELDCKPVNEFYSVKLADVVEDGTPCKLGTRDVCINGLCKRVSCDWAIEGSAQEDRCGLCHGDGTQCMTYRGVFNVSRGSGYVAAATFPRHSRHIRVREVDDAANYLSVRNNLTGEYFLNGNWLIQWSGEYFAEGTMIYYSREGETEELFMPGPLKVPLTLLLLFQTENPGVEWEYTLPRENATYTPTFSWKHSDWSVCTVTCGGGKQVSRVQCMEKEAGLVEDRYCSGQPRPEDRSRECNIHSCPAWWWSGPWQPCSVTCGFGGTRRRTVICVRSFGPTEQMALLDSDCDEDEKPHESEVCPELPTCPKMVDWSVGPWNQSCKLDPCEFEEREVVCVAPEGRCDPLSRPADRRQCGNITCGEWDVGDWSECSTQCGEGFQFRRVTCIGGLACREKDEPKSVQACEGDCVARDETLPEYEYVGIGLEYNEEDGAESESTLQEYALEYTDLKPVTLPEYDDTRKGIERVPKKKNEEYGKDDMEAEQRSGEEESEGEGRGEKDKDISKDSKQNRFTEVEDKKASAVDENMKKKQDAEIDEDPGNSSEDDGENGAAPDHEERKKSTEETLLEYEDYSPIELQEDALNSTAAIPLTTFTPPITTIKTVDVATTDVSATPISTSITTSTTLSDESETPGSTFEATSTPAVLEDVTSTTTVSSMEIEATTNEPTLLVESEPDLKPTDVSQSPATHSDVYRMRNTDDAVIGDVKTPTHSPKLSEKVPDLKLTQEDSSEENAAVEIANEIHTDFKPSKSKTDEFLPKVEQKPSKHLEEVNATVNSGEGERDPLFTEEEDGSDEVEEEKTRIDLKAPVMEEEPVGTREPFLTEGLTVLESPTWIEEPSLNDKSGGEGKIGSEEEEASEEENQDDEETMKHHVNDETTDEKTNEEHKENDTKVVNTGKEEKKKEMKEEVYEEEYENAKKRGDDESTENEEVIQERQEQGERESKIEPELREGSENVEEHVDDEENFFEEDEKEEQRPEGIAVDKINPDDFEVIEIVDVQAKESSKKNKKKVLVHTGEEAVNVLHELAEEQLSRQTTSTSTTTTTTTTTTPEPPNYEWHIGNWSECSVECGGGFRTRVVECRNLATMTLADPDFCDPSLPPEQETCNSMECAEWEVEEWGECEGECDVGERQRRIYCPEGRRCSPETRPPEAEPCELSPCITWVEGPWSLCTKSCGGGYQIRHVKCVDVRTQEKMRTCNRDSKPKHKLACNKHRCPKNRRGQQKRCRDRLDTKLCKRLKHMCTTKFFAVKCCRTCLGRQ